MSEAAISLPIEGLAWCGFTITNSKIKNLWEDIEKASMEIWLNTMTPM